MSIFLGLLLLAAAPETPRAAPESPWSAIQFMVGEARRTLVLRQFHQESFVNQFVLVAGSPEGTIVFESEALENVPGGWKAKETYEVVVPGRVCRDLRARGGGWSLRGVQQGTVQARATAVGRRPERLRGALAAESP